METQLFSRLEEHQGIREKKVNFLTRLHFLVKLKVLLHKSKSVTCYALYLLLGFQPLNVICVCIIHFL